MRMRGSAELPDFEQCEAGVNSGRTRTFLAPFGCEELKVVHGEEEDKSAGILIIPKFPE